MTLFSPDLIAAWSSSPYALAILGILSFSESAFFIIPPELMFIPMGLINPSTAIPLSIFVSFTSIMGAAFGYFIGVKGGKPILQRLFSQKKIDNVSNLYKKYDAWAIIIAAFTPIPFKVFTVSAGVFDINFKRMIIASIIGRSSRYILLGALVYIFGDSIKYFLEHQLDKVMLIGTIAAIGGFILYKFIYPQLVAHFTKLTLKDRIRAIFKH